jgi:lysophospholipase L1-like esterase
MYSPSFCEVRFPMKMRFFSLSAALWLASTGWAQSPKKVSIALFGDSITRGVLADDQLGEDSDAADAVDLIRLVINGATAGYQPEGEGVLNFKLMTDNTYLARDPLASVQGQAPYSIGVRLKQDKNIEADIINVAKLGGSFRMGELQLSLFERALRERQLKAADLIIVDLGRIDYTITLDEAVFAKNVDRFFSDLLQISPGSRILLTRVADIPSTINREDRRAARLLRSISLSCADIYNQGAVAAKTGLKPGVVQPDALAREQRRRDALNDILAKKSSELQALGVNIAFVKSLDERPDANAWDAIMANDCIHLNSEGQKEIADNIFPVVTQLLEGSSSSLVSTEKPRPSVLPEAARQAWQAYVASLPLASIQEDCKPAMLEPESISYRGVVMLYHGFTACPQQFLELGQRLTAQGFVVLLPLNPGHGRLYSQSQGKNRDDLSALPTGRPQEANSYLAYFRFVNQMNDIVRQFPGERVVGGLSLGAAFASFASIQDPYLWDRQLIMSPLYELSERVTRNILGSLSNLNNLNNRFGNLLAPILNVDQGWGQGCEDERNPDYVSQFGRTGTRAGICQFKITHALGSNQFGFDVWNLLQPTRIKTQFVVVQDDPVINKQLVFNGVGRMRGEQLKRPEFQTEQRLDQDASVRICYLPSSNMVCASNMNKPLEEQERNCINHSLLSRYDAPFQNKYWIDILEPKLLSFIANGTYFSTEADRAHNDPICAGFR